MDGWGATALWRKGAGKGGEFEESMFNKALNTKFPRKAFGSTAGI